MYKISKAPSGRGKIYKSPECEVATLACDAVVMTSGSTDNTINPWEEDLESIYFYGSDTL